MASAMRPSSTVKVSVLRDVEDRKEVGIDRVEDRELDGEQHERAEFGRGERPPQDEVFRQATSASDSRDRANGFTS